MPITHADIQRARAMLGDETVRRSAQVSDSAMQSLASQYNSTYLEMLSDMGQAAFLGDTVTIRRPTRYVSEEPPAYVPLPQTMYVAVLIGPNGHNVSPQCERRADVLRWLEGKEYYDLQILKTSERMTQLPEESIV